MHRYSRMHLPPEVAMRNLDAIDLEEKSRIAEGLALIAVIDERRDCLAAGYPCMRNYCMGRLHMSEGRALRRIQVARAAVMPNQGRSLAGRGHTRGPGSCGRSRGGWFAQRPARQRGP